MFHLNSLLCSAPAHYSFIQKTNNVNFKFRDKSCHLWYRKHLDLNYQWLRCHEAHWVEQTLHVQHATVLAAVGPGSNSPVAPCCMSFCLSLPPHFLPPPPSSYYQWLLKDNEAISDLKKRSENACLCWYIYILHKTPKRRAAKCNISSTTTAC